MRLCCAWTSSGEAAGRECPNEMDNSSYESEPDLASVLTRCIGVLAACIFSPSRHDACETV